MSSAWKAPVTVMAKSWLFPLFAASVLCLLPSSSALPNGAPPSACVSMAPVHRGVQPQGGEPPYSLKVGAGSYKSGQGVTVQIVGPIYRGVLLQARMLPDTTPIGSWISPPADTKNLLCSGNEKGAITHANTNEKTNATTFTWMPPEANCPDAVTFVATVAESNAVYYLGVKSTPLPIESKVLCRSANSGSSTIEKATWTSSILLLLAVNLFLLGCTY